MYLLTTVFDRSSGWLFPRQTATCHVCTSIHLFLPFTQTSYTRLYASDVPRIDDDLAILCYLSRFKKFPCWWRWVTGDGKLPHTSSATSFGRKQKKYVHLSISSLTIVRRGCPVLEQRVLQHSQILASKFILWQNFVATNYITLFPRKAWSL